MTVSMYQVSAPIFVQFLTALSSVLDKAAAYADAKKIDHQNLLNMRLAPDMFTLLQQVQQATNHAASGVGRPAGIEPIKFEGKETNFTELKDRIAKTIDFIKGIKASQVDGTEAKDIVVKFPNGNERQFTGQTLLLNFALPNFYFHCTTAYDILRHAGVEVGKRDFMGAPVQL